jgi:hypothetical protein
MMTLKRTTAPFFALVALSLAAFGTTTVAAASATRGSPTSALRSFAFESEVRILGAAPDTEFSISTEGVFVAPSSEDCQAHLDLGVLEYDERAVIFGTRAYLDEGDGFEAVDASDVSFRSMCPSNPEFWEGIPDLPASFEGVPDTRNGVKVERYDFTSAASALSGFTRDIPDGVTFDQLTLYLARKGRWPVAIGVRLSAETDEACAAMGDSVGAGDVLTAPCSVSQTVELSRPNDARLTVKIPKSAGLS